MKYLTASLYGCLVALLLLTFGCHSKSERELKEAKYQAEQTQQEQTHSIVSPPGSSNLVALGSGWYTFEFEGNKFLGRRKGYRQVLTQIIP